jgi:hypothetical protein
MDARDNSIRGHRHSLAGDLVHDRPKVGLTCLRAANPERRTVFRLHFRSKGFRRQFGGAHRVAIALLARGRCWLRPVMIV